MGSLDAFLLLWYLCFLRAVLPVLVFSGDVYVPGGHLPAWLCSDSVPCFGEIWCCLKPNLGFAHWPWPQALGEATLGFPIREEAQS